MKKFLALLLVLSMVFTLCACGKKTDDSKYTGKLVVYSPHLSLIHISEPTRH